MKVTKIETGMAHDIYYENQGRRQGRNSDNKERTSRILWMDRSHSSQGETFEQLLIKEFSAQKTGGDLFTQGEPGHKTVSANEEKAVRFLKEYWA